MKILSFGLTILIVYNSVSSQTLVYENDMNFRIEAGGRTCFFESGRHGQTLEAQYQVLDGQHGDLDITFEITDPNGIKLLEDYKKTQNSVIMELEEDGDYVFCMDNSFSMINSKLVFVYVMIEDKAADYHDEDHEGDVEDENGEEKKEKAILEWMGTNEDGEDYYIEVAKIADSLTRTLKHVIKARHLLDFYGALKTRDSYLAFKDTSIVDMWSAFQICFMIVVGMVQVYMIKKLFNSSSRY